jgi:hypothetical protein
MNKVGLAVAAIAVVVSGCDNVEWGGIQVEVKEPTFARPDSLGAEADSLVQPPPLEMPAGPLLFHVRRIDAAGHALIEPVAELAGMQLRPVGPRLADQAAEYISEFVARYFQPNSAYLLFRGEARVGTFYVGSSAVAGGGLCPELRAEGHVELRPGVDTLSEFLAWPPGVRAGADSLELPASRTGMVSLAQVLARRGIQEGGLEGAWRIRAPADLRALQVGEGSLGFAAAFMVGDSLGPGAPADSAGSAFIVADYNPSTGYFPIYFDASWYAPGQKRALRWLDAADLLGGPETEWLLRAYGDAGAWYELVGQRDTARAVVWSSRRPVCEAR